ncbi:hypothetical protein HBP65_13325 [Listeria welshimeri]|nr:hypothetical protein [Listeria welshimeri]
MANLSEAYGTLFISKEVIQNDFSSVELLLTSLCALEGRSEYGIFPVDDIDKLSSDLNKARELKTKLSLSFLGTGKWNLANYIYYFFEHLTIFHHIVKFTAFSKPNQTLIFDFVDYEPAGGVFYKGIYEISLQETDKTWETTTEVKQQNSLPRTAKNLMYYGMCEEAYDEDNLSLLLDNETFINELIYSIPKKEITLHFLQTFWAENWLGTKDMFTILEYIEDMSEFYHEFYQKPLS